MRTVHARQYEMLLRVCRFVESHRDRLPDSAAARQAVATVTAAVTALRKHGVSGLSGAENRTKARAREALVARLETTARTAGAIEETRTLARVLRGVRRQTDHMLLMVGRVAVEKAPVFKRAFIEHGMSDTFVADLQALVEAFERSTRRRDAGRSAQAGARVGMAAALSSGCAAVHTLDAMVTNRFEDDPMTMAVWERDRRVEYPRRRRRVVVAHSAALASLGPAQAATVQPAAVIPAPLPALAPTAVPALTAPQSQGAERIHAVLVSGSIVKRLEFTTTATDGVRELLSRLPNDCSAAEARHHLDVVQAVDRSEADEEAGRAPTERGQ